MFDIGELDSFAPIEGGIENSNYFVTLVNGENRVEFVLTITESLGFEEVGFFNDLLSKLTVAGLPVPMPERTLDGMYSTIFCGKPAWLFPRLPGRHPETVSAAQCETIGKTLAQLHEAAVAARYTRANPYPAAWAHQTLAARGGELDAPDRAMIAAIANEYAGLETASDLPRGIIHGDLFRDNALFEDSKLTGIIDFYHACDDFLVQDLAITLNEWCTHRSGLVDMQRFDAMLQGYESVRTLSEAEKTHLPAFRRAGAMRFVLTRLLSGDGTNYLKDPEEFLRIARALYASE